MSLATKRGSTSCGFENLETPQSQRAKATFLIDLRKTPRFDTHFPGEAIGRSGERAFVTIANISRSGLRLEGSRQMVGAILPGVELRAEHTPTLLKVNFALPTDLDHLADVKVECRTSYVRREDGDVCQIGMEFMEFDEGCEELHEYVLNRETTR